MKTTLITRLYIGFSIAVILVLIGGYLTFSAFRKQTAMATWVDHSYRNLNDVERIQRLMFDLEAGRRGFRSTNDERFLQPYRVSLPKVLPAIEGLKKAMADNPAQVQRINVLEKDVDVLLAFWVKLEKAHVETFTLEEKTRVTEEEEGLMKKVNEEIGLIRTAERELLLSREKENSDFIEHSISTLLITTAFILLVVVVLIVITFKECRNRVRTEALLKDKLDELSEINSEANEKNWVLTGISIINENMRAHTAMGELAKKTLQAITGYLGLPPGAFYFYDERKEALTLQATVALPEHVKQTYKLDEGIIGAAATHPDITVLKNVPPDFWKITAASGEVLPGSIICVPLWMNDELKGVLELATFQEPESGHITLLQKVASDLGIVVNAVSARERVMELLEEVQEQKEILETQQEELRQTNEELTRQSDILQASEEELRVQEEELRQINAEIGEKNKDLETARTELSIKAAELELSSRYKSEFLANMSHELRTPLNSVLILAKLLEENKQKNLTGKQVEYVGIIHKSGSDLLKLINDILDLSKIEAGKIEMHVEQVAVKEVVYDLEQLFQVVAAEKQIQFVTRIATGVPEHIQTDQQRLEQVMKNLLSNAFKFTPAGGTVTLSLFTREHTANALYLSVTDTGVGIATDKQQLIFEAFQQADGSTSRRYGGTGLGLSISKELVKWLGGNITLESTEGVGSTFTLRIPLDGHTVLEKENIPEPVKEVVVPKHTSSILLPQETVADDREDVQKTDKLILIIEDDPNFATIVRDFAREKGFKTIVALNGDDGLYYARKCLPTAIILDMNLPVIDGSSILKILKSSDALKHILVHVISANEVSGHVINSINGYTQKPLQIEDLEAVFSNISHHIQSRFKQVLIVSDNLLDNVLQLKSLSDKRQMETAYDQVPTLPEAFEELQKKKYDCVILDIGTDVSEGTARLKALWDFTKGKDIPIMVYLDKDISVGDEAQLKKYAAAIIRNSIYATDRLMDELELFLYKLKEIETRVVPVAKPDLTEQTLKGKKVLLADDDMRNVFSLSALLEEYGFEVITAGDGKEALELLHKHPDTDIVLMDIMMPEMDGYEAMRHIRKDGRFLQLPVIALTAKAMTGDREKCMEAGASDYIAKPVDNNKLLSLMRVWLS
jgi:signal transduction histidine kinase/DNA-binding response OmpR family regulator/CHASE3 domain sensor protein